MMSVEVLFRWTGRLTYDMSLVEEALPTIVHRYLA